MAGIKGIGEAHTYDGSSLRIGIIHARWNTRIIDSLLTGTLASLHKAGVKDENIVIQSVPGSYELPYAVQQMYKSSQTQAASSSVSGLGGLVSSATQDLLGGSTTDLTQLPKDNKPAAGQSGEKGGSKQPFDALIAIGALIKGSTMHFEYISDAVSHGLMKVQLETNRSPTNNYKPIKLNQSTLYQNNHHHVCTSGNHKHRWSGGLRRQGCRLSREEAGPGPQQAEIYQRKGHRQGPWCL